MRILIQRVTSGKVDIEQQTVGQIGRGLVVLVGVAKEDTEADARYLAEKCVNLRIFEDDVGKMNRSLLDVGGAALLVSQFTLYGDCSHGRRPDFAPAALPEPAEKIYEIFVACVRALHVPVATGRFGADMQVEIHNDGPVTFMIESKR